MPHLLLVGLLIWILGLIVANITRHRLEIPFISLMTSLWDNLSIVKLTITGVVRVMRAPDIIWCHDYLWSISVFGFSKLVIVFHSHLVRLPNDAVFIRDNWDKCDIVLLLVVYRIVSLMPLISQNKTGEWKLYDKNNLKMNSPSYWYIFGDKCDIK